MSNITITLNMKEIQVEKPPKQGWYMTLNYGMLATAYYSRGRFFEDESKWRSISPSHWCETPEVKL